MIKPIHDLLDDVRYSRTYPADAFRELYIRKDESAPVLLELIADPAQVYDEVLDNLEEAPFYAMILLASIRDQRAFPLLIALLEYQDSDTDDFWADFLLDCMAQILASTYNGDLQALQKLARNPNVTDQIRSVASTTTGVLGIHGLLHREHLVAETLALWSTQLDQNEPYGSFQYSIAVLAMDLQITELRPWLESDVATWPSKVITLEEIRDLFAKTPEEARNCCLDCYGNDLIDNPMDLLEKWWCINQVSEDDSNEFDFANQIQQPLVRSEPKVGRNDPCPCNSGKKFKKCCGE